MSNYTLNEVQQQVLKDIAAAEMRPIEQMLSLLLVQGVRFYFADYISPFYNEVDADKLENKLLADATIKYTEEWRLANQERYWLLVASLSWSPMDTTLQRVSQTWHIPPKE